MDLCIICGKHPVAMSARKTKTGKIRWRKRCQDCIYTSRAIRQNGARTNRNRYKKLSCEECGFVAVHPCQLDIDHIDGDRMNDSPGNLRTLCSNCHRLKTQLSRDNVIYGKTGFCVQTDQISLELPMN